MLTIDTNLKPQRKPLSLINLSPGDIFVFTGDFESRTNEIKKYVYFVSKTDTTKKRMITNLEKFETIAAENYEHYYVIKIENPVLTINF